MAKIVCVLYDDPVTGYPKTCARDDLPHPERYPDGQTLPTPKRIDFKPGTLLGSVSGELGLRKYLESNGHQLVVTSSKDGEDSVLDRELHDAEIVISQPFWPAYMTAERIAKSPKLKMIVTAGIGSDHTDLQAAIDRGITVAEIGLRVLRPCEHAFAIFRETFEAPAALDDDDAQLFLDAPYGARQRRLRHVAGRGRTAEVLLARQCDDVVQLPDEHRCTGKPAGAGGRISRCRPSRSRP